MLLFNNLLALPLMVAYMVVGTRELQEIRYFPQLDDPLFLVRRLCKHRTWCGARCRPDPTLQCAQSPYSLGNRLVLRSADGAGVVAVPSGCAGRRCMGLDLRRGAWLCAIELRRVEEVSWGGHPAAFASALASICAGP